MDDFRTQQIIVSSKLSGQWSALVDYSLLTLDDGMDAERVDQLSASLGNELLSRDTGNRVDRVAMGFGLRSAGSFAGERGDWRTGYKDLVFIQN